MKKILLPELLVAVLAIFVTTLTGCGSGGLAEAGATEIGVYNVVDFGAVGDGTTDDTAAIQAAIDAVEAAGNGEVFAPPLTFRTTATLTAENTRFMGSFLKLNFGQATILADSGLGGPILQLGGDDEQHANIDLAGGFFRMSAIDFDKTSGIRLANLYCSSIEDVKVYGCQRGIELSSINSSDGTAYNSIHFRQISDCYFAIYLESDSAGWVNENFFYGGRVSYSGALSKTDMSGSAGIYMKPADPGGTSKYTMNKHTFSGVSLEFSVNENIYTAVNGFTRPPAVVSKASYCTFLNVRTEGWGSPVAIFEAPAARNQWIGGNLSHPNSEFENIGKLRCSYFGLRHNNLNGGSEDAPILALRSASGGYEGLHIYSALDTIPGYSVDDHGQVKVGAANDIKRYWGSGSPEGVISAGKGSIYQRRDGSPGTGLYVKESGAGDMGWVVQGRLSATASADDTTPSVLDARYLIFPANSDPGAIVQLDDGRENQTVTLVCLSATNPPKVLDGGNFSLSGDWIPGKDDTLTPFTSTGTEWIEVCRSNN